MWRLWGYRANELERIPNSRHPFEMWVLIGFFITGIGNLTGLTEAGSVIELLHPWAATVWSLLVMFTTALCVAGSWTRDRVMGLLLEKIGMYGLAGTGLVYGLAILWVFRSDGASAATIILSVSIAALHRARDIDIELEQVKRFIEEVME